MHDPDYARQLHRRSGSLKHDFDGSTNRLRREGFEIAAAQADVAKEAAQRGIASALAELGLATKVVACSRPLIHSERFKHASCPRPQVTKGVRRQEVSIKIRVMSDISSAYLSEVVRALHAYKKLAEGALAQVNDEEFFHKPNSESLSCALVVKHIAGNLRSRFTDFLTSDGEKPDRHREQEFEDAAGATRTGLMRSWEENWGLLFRTLDALRPEDVERTVTIYGEPYSVLKALNVACLHYAYHIGQIAYVAKHLRGRRWKSLSVPKPGQEKYKP